jgi:hypothetical protein
MTALNHYAFIAGMIAIVLTLLSWAVEFMVAVYRRWYVHRLRKLEREYIANARKLGITYESPEDFRFWSWIGEDS